MGLHIHIYSPWAPLGDYSDRWFRICEKCGKTQISASR